MAYTMRPDDTALRQMLAAGILAPSADNRPALQLRILDAAVELLATDLAAWDLQPHRRALGLLAAGAMIENIALRSGALGHGLQVAVLPDPARRELLATLRWQGPMPPIDPLHEAIEGRHTNRRFFRREPLPASVLATLSGAATPVAGAQLHWLQGPRRRLALRAIRWAETERFRRRALHAEMFGAIRFDVGWGDSADQGLPPGTLEVEPPLRAPFALLRHWPVMRAAHALGSHWMLGLRAGWLPCAMAPQLGLITAERSEGDRGWIQAGRLFQRVWLAAHRQGLALQPMAASVALSLQYAGGDWVSPGVQGRLRAALQAVCGAQHEVQQPCMVFRLGHAAAPTVVTGRGLFSHYITPDSVALANPEKSTSAGS